MFCHLTLIHFLLIRHFSTVHSLVWIFLISFNLNFFALLILSFLKIFNILYNKYYFAFTSLIISKPPLIIYCVDKCVSQNLFHFFLSLLSKLISHSIFLVPLKIVSIVKIIDPSFSTLGTS